MLGLPESFAPFEGQVQTRTTRQFRVYENYDFTGPKMSIYYTIEKQADTVSMFGMYPFNYLAGAIYQMGFNIGPETPEGQTLLKPAKWVKHEAPSSLAGQLVYYVDAKIVVNQSSIDFISEPFETVVNGIAEDMKDPLIRVGYYGRTIVKGTDGKPRISWQSKYAITPKRRLRKTEFLQVAKMSLDQYMYESRTSWNIVKVDSNTHITSIAMDIELNNDALKSVVYINGLDVKTYNYRNLINSFGQKYNGFLWMYRLNNGVNNTAGVNNVYGSTLNIPLSETSDSTIYVKAGSINAYDTNTKILTYNPDLETEASIIAYMEFLPAGGKNENCGRQYNFETGIESLF